MTEGASSSQHPPGGTVDDHGRKIWDKDFYTEKAKQNIMFGPERLGKRKDPVIPIPFSHRTFLKQRSADLQLDKDLGKSKLVTPHTIKPLQGGYWCSVCECLIKDSAAYLDHVNGRRHNRNLGMNMKVEKITVDRVREKLKSIKKTPDAVNPEEIAAKIEAIEAEFEEKKRKKKLKHNKKKRRKTINMEQCGDKVGNSDQDVDGETENEDDEDEPEETKMLRQLGLPTGFG